MLHPHGSTARHRTRDTGIQVDPKKKILKETQEMVKKPYGMFPKCALEMNIKQHGVFPRNEQDDLGLT